MVAAYGRKPFLLAVCLAIFLFGTAFTLATSMWFLLVGNTVEGIFAVGFSTGQAFMADVTTDANGEATPNRAVSMAAYYGVTQGATAVVGTLLALVAMQGLGWSAQETFQIIVILAIMEVPI